MTKIVISILHFTGRKCFLSPFLSAAEHSFARWKSLGWYAVLVSLGLGGDRGTVGTEGVHDHLPPPSQWANYIHLIRIIWNEDAENITGGALEELFSHQSSSCWANNSWCGAGGIACAS